jgi:hypothetical protein
MELLHAVRHKTETSGYGTGGLFSGHQQHNRNIANRQKGIMHEYGGDMSRESCDKEENAFE